jgi:hypothetical protein
MRSFTQASKLSTVKGSIHPSSAASAPTRLCRSSGSVGHEGQPPQASPCSAARLSKSRAMYLTFCASLRSATLLSFISGRTLNGRHRTVTPAASASRPIRMTGR